jgi:hypothetical protein
VSEKITPKQLRSLQTLYGKYAQHALVAANTQERAERLSWASQRVGREVSSFSELSSTEAAALIDQLKETLGQAVSPPRRKRLGREAAQARGAHGRRGRKVRVEMMATAEDLAEVERLRERAGMTREEFEAWLTSRYSPLRGRADTALRTVSDCNRVRWGLKAIIRHAAAHPAEAAPELAQHTAAKVS